MDVGSQRQLESGPACGACISYHEMRTRCSLVRYICLRHGERTDLWTVLLLCTLV